jgi:hypothetical protein
LPKQPRKHIRSLGLDDGARLAMRALATGVDYPTVCAIFDQSR